MLFVDSSFESFFFFCVERQQIVIFIRAPVEYAAPAMDGRIDDRGVDAAIFGLNVKNRAIHCYVGVMTEEHSLAHPNFDRCEYRPQNFLVAALTQRRPLVIITLRP